MSHNHFVKLILFILIVLCSSFSVKADIEVPFDYLYGRWVDGHYYNGEVIDREYSKDLTAKSSYSFTSDFFKINAVDLENYIIWGNYNNVNETPTFNVLFRPKSNWQIAVNNIRYYKYASDEPAGYFDNTSSFLNRKHITVNLESKWMNRKSLNVDSRFVPYSYLNGFWLEKGGIIITTELSYDYYNFKIQHYNHAYSTNNQITDLLDDSDNRYSIKNKVQFAPLNNLNCSFDFSMFLRNDFADDYSSYIGQNNIVRQLYRQSSIRSYSPYLNLRIKYALLKQLYLSGSIYSNYNKKNFESEYRSYSFDSIVKINRNVDEGKLTLTRIGYSGNLYYISKGEFNENILLDDYNNFYNHMLFRKQLNLSASILYHKRDHYPLDDDINADIILKAGYGLLTNFDIYVNAKSSYSKTYRQDENYFGSGYLTYARSNNTLRGDIHLRYRSFSYSENSKQGWSKDSRYDIALTPMIDFGQYLVELTYNSPSYENDSEFESKNIFDFSDLTKYGYSNVQFLITAGLGKQFISKLSCNLRNWISKYRSFSYQLDINKRIYKRFELNTSIIDAIITPTRWWELRGSIQILY